MVLGQPARPRARRSRGLARARARARAMWAMTAAGFAAVALLGGLLWSAKDPWTDGPVTGPLAATAGWPDPAATSGAAPAQAPGADASGSGWSRAAVAWAPGSQRPAAATAGQRSPNDQTAGQPVAPRPAAVIASAAGARPAPPDESRIDAQQRQAIDAMVSTPPRQSASALAAAQGQPKPARLARDARRPAAEAPKPPAAPAAGDAQLPVYPGATLLAGQSDRRADADSETVTVVLATTAPLEQVKAYYQGELQGRTGGDQRLRSQDNGQTWRLANDAQRQLQSVRMASTGQSTIIELSNTRWR